MEILDRTLYDAFQNDETTLPVRKLRSTLGTRLDEALSFTHKLASGEESMSFRSIEEAQNGLLRAYQIQYAINVACGRIVGHGEVVTKIMSDMDARIHKAVTYMSEVNRWVATIQGAGRKV
ncbi:hypothetical protein [Pseudomonas syringae]|uniref:hypothetical protein n=1 Tax=Pseudomonas syringae TaxID=317 RepID=UPI000EFEC2F5|nr:hypothetical protein [Pseudomonas syringae]MCF5736426.1 hypothetical protein [Pseudomonas syringae]MCF5742277.1 hypothetical protein [Pseudomonas syringae]MCF5751569.1 hypothetical protein [Pseudomonas syringae]MCF5758143.1 hypothetical protein [Pseudomonas syringae]RMM50650.1 hypothetical protein ALQ76_00792 [Pseudomonas syringae pv. atrofaciens]